MRRHRLLLSFVAATITASVAEVAPPPVMDKVRMVHGLHPAEPNAKRGSKDEKEKRKRKEDDEDEVGLPSVL